MGLQNTLFVGHGERDTERERHETLTVRLWRGRERERGGLLILGTSGLSWESLVMPPWCGVGWGNVHAITYLRVNFTLHSFTFIRLLFSTFYF